MNKRELLAERKHLFSEKVKLDDAEKALHKRMAEVSEQLKQYCLEDGHDWTQSSWGSRGHYWHCQVCGHSGSGRHVDKPDKWHDIPRKDRRPKRGSIKKFRIYNPNR